MSDSSDQRRVSGGTTTKTKAPEVSIARLPATNRELFGREAELLWLDACWREGVHVASIVAWGGVGKSALVNKWLANLRDEGWCGAERVYGWSFYSQGTDRLGSSDQFVDAALRWLGDPDSAQGSPWDKGERLARLVRKERTLLVLDGVEPMQWGPGVQEGRFRDPALESLLKELGGQNEGLCLVTTRIALADLDGLSGNKVRTKNLDNLSPEAGARLLKERGARGSDEELRQASDEYKGHGLALTLLGSYLGEVAEGDIHRRREIGPLLEEEGHGGHARRVMEAYEAWLGKPEVAILHMLGLFDRPVEEDEIEALRAEPGIPGLTDAPTRADGRAWNKAVTKLRKVGLLSAEQDKRIDAHPLVREHFGEQFKREQLEAWQEGHRRLYEHLKTKAKLLPETIEEMAPLYEAVVHGCRAGRYQDAYRLYWERMRRSKWVVWDRMGAFTRDLNALSAFFEPLWQVEASLEEQAKHRIRNAVGYTLRALGRLDDALPLMEQVLAGDIEKHDWKDAARDAGNLSDLLLARGELERALKVARESVELAERSGDDSQRATKRMTLGGVLCQMGRLRESVDETRKLEPSAEWSSFSIASYRLCDILIEDDRIDEARSHARASLQVSTRDRQLVNMGLDHLSLGRADLLKHDIEGATLNLQKAVESMRRAHRLEHLPRGLLARAALHTHTRAFVEARHDLDETLSLSTRCGFRLHEADAHLGHARLCLAEERPAVAGGHLTKARRIIDETGYHRRDGELATLEAEAAEMAKNIPPPAPLPLPPAPGLAKPMTTPAAPQPVDIGIVIALPEELRQLLDLTGGYTKHPSADLDSYLFTRGAYRCAVTLVGEMGEAQAGVFTERLIARLDPAIILSIGIAGGVNDLLAGDVHVPPQAVQYIQDSKAAPAAGGGFAVVPGAPAYRADFALLKAARAFEFDHPAAHKQWIADCAADLAVLLPDPAKRSALVADKQVRGDVGLLADGHVATGPIVGAARAFSDWIRTHDRHVKSLEMESAAVLLAAQNRTVPKRALALRGISDFGDEHKKELDEKGDGVLRKYAMRNAVRLLWALLDAEALPPLQNRC